MLAVDDLPNLDDAPLEFVYGKDLLPNWILCDCPSYMQRMHNWYKRACRLGLKTIYAPHHLDVFGVKSMISCLILQTSSTCSASKNLVSKWFDYGACKCLIDTNILYVMTLNTIYAYLINWRTFYPTGCKQVMLLL